MPTCITARPPAAHQIMELTKTERERITDSVLKIQSVRDSLDHVGKSKIPKREEIEMCLASADIGFREALGYLRPESETATKKPNSKRKAST